MIQYVRGLAVFVAIACLIGVTVTHDQTRVVSRVHMVYAAPDAAAVWQTQHPSPAPLPVQQLIVQFQDTIATVASAVAAVTPGEQGAAANVIAAQADLSEVQQYLGTAEADAATGRNGYNQVVAEIKAGDSLLMAAQKAASGSG